MIQAQLPDGTALQFPDGTADSVIDQAVSEHVKTAAPQGGEHGYAYAPPEEKPPQLSASDPAGGTIGADGSYVRRPLFQRRGRHRRQRQPSRSMLGLLTQLTPEQRNQIDALPARRVASRQEGWQNAPTLLPQRAGSRSRRVWLGVNQPLVHDQGNTILGAGNALLSSAQRSPVVDVPTGKTLARGLGRAWAFPTGDYGGVARPRSVVCRRAMR